MNTKFVTLLAAGSLAVASIAYGQTTAPATTPAPAATPAAAANQAAPARDLNKEATAMKSSAGSSGTPTTSVKEKRSTVQTPEQKAAAQKEMQKRSTSSAGAQPATVDKNAPKANPRKAYKDMTPEEKKQLQDAAQKASN